MSSSFKQSERHVNRTRLKEDDMEEDWAWWEGPLILAFMGVMIAIAIPVHINSLHMQVCPTEAWMTNRWGEIFFWTIVVTAIIFGPLVDKIIRPGKLEEINV